jgi:hypothetical protein
MGCVLGHCGSHRTPDRGNSGTPHAASPWHESHVTQGWGVQSSTAQPREGKWVKCLWQSRSPYVYVGTDPRGGHHGDGVAKPSVHPTGSVGSLRVLALMLLDFLATPAGMIRINASRAGMSKSQP